MESKLALQHLVCAYQLVFPNEEGELTDLIRFLHTTDEGLLYDRKNFKGHITTSAFVLNENKSALLLLHHKKLNRWLQPGGHADATDTSLFKSALRETTEETGLSLESLQQIPAPVHDSIFDIDSHQIPANVTRHEPGHTHHDLRFLFACTRQDTMTINNNEALGFKWVSLKELTNDVTFGKVVTKIIRAGLQNPFNVSKARQF